MFNKLEEKLSLICSERRGFEADMVEAYLKYADDEKFIELNEKYCELFKKPVTFGNNETEDKDGSGADNDGVDNAGNRKDCNVEDFGFRKISLDDMSSQEMNSQVEKEGVVQKETVIPADIDKPAENVAGVEDEELEITSTPETYTQWLENNVDMVNEVIDCIVDEYLYVIL